MAKINAQIKVELGDKSYPIIIGWDILSSLGNELARLFSGRKAMIISNPIVDKLYGEKVEAALAEANFNVIKAHIPDGEDAKNLEEAAKIYSRCCKAGLDRKSLIIALGGGVVGDLAGFVAATYMRGINFIQVPTTLLAQVDSSVGGKVGINLPEGKNLVGAFYQPSMVYMDLQTLTTLPIRELRTGIAEVIKYGVLDGDEFFTYLEQNMNRILKLDAQELAFTVQKSCQIKSQVVSIDEREGGIRAILNFGHTIGHALESLTGYRQYRHGEAIAIGMKYAGLVALNQNWWSKEEQARLEKLIEFAGLPLELPGFSSQQILDTMTLDKKNTDNKLTMVLPKKIGRVEIVAGVNTELVKEALVADV